VKALEEKLNYKDEEKEAQASEFEQEKASLKLRYELQIGELKKRIEELDEKVARTPKQAIK